MSKKRGCLFKTKKRGEIPRKSKKAYSLIKRGYAFSLYKLRVRSALLDIRGEFEKSSPLFLFHKLVGLFLHNSTIFFSLCDKVYSAGLLEIQKKSAI